MREFARWKGFFLLEPFGAEVDEMRSAMPAYVTAQVNSKKRLKLEDFVRKPWVPRRFR